MEKNKYIPHGSEEWHKVRSGRFTPSELHRLMTEPRTNSEIISEGAKTYIKEKVAETLTIDISNEKMFRGNEATEWGNSYENEAIQVFSEFINQPIIPSGFIIYDENFGGTPDGVCEDGTFGIEIKCPFNIAIHLDNLLLDSNSFKKYRKEYYWQIQGYSLLTGINDWYFVSYDPRQIKYTLKVLPIKRNEDDIQLIKEKLGLAIEYKQQLINNLKQQK
jgi:hypothetical protein